MKLLRLFIPWVSLSFVVGCFAAYFFMPSITIIVIGVYGVCISAFVLRKHGYALLVCVCAVALLLGVLRVLYAERHIQSALVADNPGVVILTGNIVSDVEQKGTRSRYIISLTTDAEQKMVALQEPTNGNEHPPAIVRKKSAVLVYEHYPTACVTGEDVSIAARLQKPEDFITETGRVFKYEQYLRQLGVHAIVFLGEDESVTCDGQADSFAIFAKMRSVFVDAMNAVLPLQEASLLGGLLLGLRGALSADLLEAFRVTGLIHIIVLSGYNITVVAEAVRRVLTRAPRFVALAVSLMTVVAFVFLAGAQTAAVRAGSMATIALVARATYREHDGIRALLLVAALMVLYNPDQVLFSVSFHLSFLATLGLLVFSPIIERNISSITDRFQVRGIVAVTLATQVFLLPYLAYTIGEVSIIGILANILILPIVPIAMAFGALITVFAMVSTTIATAFAPLAYIPLAAIIAVAVYLAKVPYASVHLPEIPALIMILLTILLTYLCFNGLRGDKRGMQDNFGGR